MTTATTNQYDQFAPPEKNYSRSTTGDLCHYLAQNPPATATEYRQTAEMLLRQAAYWQQFQGGEDRAASLAQMASAYIALAGGISR